MPHPLTVEVPIIDRDPLAEVPVIDVAVAGEAKYDFDTKTIAGSTLRYGPDAMLYPQNPYRTLIWRVDSSTPNAVAIQDLCLNGDHRHREVIINFSVPLLPSLTSINLGYESQLATITADGTLHIFRVDYTSTSTHQASSLPRVLSCGDGHDTINLAPVFDKLGAPTTMLYIGNTYLCIGTNQGNVCCLPIPAEGGGYDASRRIELQGGNSSGGSLGIVSTVLGGLFSSRSVLEPIEELVELPFVDKSLLCCIHKGAILRIWDVSHQKMIHSNALLPDPVTSASYSAAMARIILEPIDVSTSVLMVYFTAVDGSSNDQLVTYEIFIEDRDNAYKVQVESGPRLQNPVTHVIDMSLGHIGPNGIGAWLLFDTEEQPQLVCIPLVFVDGEIKPVSKTILLEDQLSTASSSLTSTRDDMIRSELWQVLKQQQPDLSTTIPLEEVIDTVLTPGLLSRKALRQALFNLGVDPSVADAVLDDDLDKIATTLPRELCRFLPTDTTTTSNGDGDDDSVFRLGDGFLSSYAVSWKALHRPLALGGHTTSQGQDTLIIVRQHGMLTMLRNGSAAEMTLHGVVPTGTDNPSPSQLCEQENEADGGIIQAMLAVGRAAGGSKSMRLLWSCMKHGSSLEDVVTPAVIKIITGGSQKQQQYQSLEAAKMRSEWRAVCRHLPLQVAAAAQNNNTDTNAIGEDSFSNLITKLIRYSHTDMASSRSRLTDLLKPAVTTTATTSAQVSWAQFETLLRFYILYSYMCWSCTLATNSLDAGVLHNLTSSVLPKIKGMLQAAAVAYWSTVTPLSSSMNNSSANNTMDPSQLVVSLHIGGEGGSGAGHDVGARKSASAPKRARLTPMTDSYACDVLYALGFVENGHVVRDLNDLHDVALAFSRWLLCIEEVGALEGVSLENSRAQPLLRIIPLAIELFRNKHGRQLAALLQLLLLAGEQLDARLLFFKACSKVRSIKDAESVEEARQLEDESVALFFRVSALFPIPDPFFMDQLVSVRACIEQLHWDTTQQTLKDEGPDAIELQYYETLMVLFERLGCSRAAARFAHAASQTVGTALAGDHLREERSKREGKLWTNVFAHNMEAGAYEEAYSAMVSNPVAELQLDCLHRLVNDLCIKNQVQLLCSLPFAHTLLLIKEGKPAWVPMLNEAISALERRAANLDLNHRPQPYKVLYSFHTARHNMQRAAAAMLSYARRLQIEHPHDKSSVVEVERALSVAVASLSLVDPSQAWLLDSLSPASYPPGRPSTLLSSYTGQDTVTTVLTLEDLKRQHATAAAYAALVCAMPGGEATSAATDDVLDQLLVLNMFEEAFKLVDAVYQGTELDDKRQQVVGALAERCVILQSASNSSGGGGGSADGANTRHMTMRLASSDAAMVDAVDDDTDAMDDDVVGRGHHQQQSGVIGNNTASVSPAAAAAVWKQLYKHLVRYESINPVGYRLRLVAAESILSREPRFCLPPRLTAPFFPPITSLPTMYQQQSDTTTNKKNNKADFAGLVRLYMRHGRLDDAAHVAAQHLLVITTSVPSVSMARSGAVCIPHTLLQELLERMKDARDDSTVSLSRQLKDLLGQEQNAAERQTQIIAQIYAS